MKNTSPRTVAVIGAGAAGLAATRELTERGYTVTCFDRDDRVGGHWNHDYEALHLITPKSTSMFRGFPQPADYPAYPSRDQIIAYMESFARRFDLLRHIRLGTAVADVRPVGTGDGLNGWEVELGTGETLPFDAVVVANGHLHHPYVPELPGEFAGKVLHSVDYRNTGDLDGERVLVIGSGNSGCDLAVDAAQARHEVSISIRHGFVFMPKSILGRPRAELPTQKLPPKLAALVLRYLVRVSVGRPEQYAGLPKPPSRDLTKQRSIVNDLLPYWIQHGRVRVRPAVAEVRGTTVTFDDGTSDDFDTILLATGFRYEASFLSESVMRRENDMPRRWASGTLVDGLSNLFLVGLIAPMGAQWPVYDQQAALIGDLIELQRASPTAPIVREFQKGDEGFGDLELQRPAWDAMHRSTLGTVARVRQGLLGATS
ncbi:flavin-containing monooxygenase [Streptomyces sp. SHP 1-2]|uniref:flavin-containing monooxygenase n=1 Tax=Streptomyces sp. SHP 1-2 TaxID=2769489 RepID=UPI00223747F6|nr:FAD-dependent oxidoreductase [Streptomyces sp. SHP 1-2]MCW5250428.1 NAD(P)-binding domain-containing protein [Streptomyces sp. SHP 1-2]